MKQPNCDRFSGRTRPAGRYLAAKSPVYVIKLEGDHLMAGREGRTLQPLLVEASNLMFSAGEPRCAETLPARPTDQAVWTSSEITSNLVRIAGP
jgi:hypothetical protein